MGSSRFPSACNYDNHIFMASSISDNQKRPRGRPATGVTPMAGVRLEPDFRAEIEAWAAKQKDKPALAEAMRRLIRRALDSPGAKPRRPAKRASKPKAD